MVGRGQSRQRALVETKGVVVGVDHAGAIAGRPQVARTLLPLRAQPEMMAEHRQVLEPLGVVAGKPFEGGADPSMHVGPALQEQVLIDHVLQKRLRKAVALRRERARSGNLLDDFRIAKQLETCFEPGGIGCHRLEQRGIEARANDGSFLGQPARLLRQPVDAGEQHRLDGGRNAGRGIILHHLPLLAVALQHAKIDQAAHDLLDEQRIAARAVEDLVVEPRGGILPSFRRKAPPADCVRRRCRAATA